MKEDNRIIVYYSCVPKINDELVNDEDLVPGAIVNQDFKYFNTKEEAYAFADRWLINEKYMPNYFYYIDGIFPMSSSLKEDYKNNANLLSRLDEGKRFALNCSSDDIGLESYHCDISSYIIIKKVEGEEIFSVIDNIDGDENVVCVLDRRKLSKAIIKY